MGDIQVVDANLTRWLGKVRDRWGGDHQEDAISQVAGQLAVDEIANRMRHYPAVKQALEQVPLDIHGFGEVARECWVFGHRFDAIRLRAFVDNGDASSLAIGRLVEDFPEAEDAAARRIDRFTEEAVGLGFRKPNDGRDLAGAAQLASLVLTALKPERFVDYKRARWKRWADEFGYPTPPPVPPHGAWIVWAGRFASDMAATPTYRHYWPNSTTDLKEPAWVISALCWEGLEPERPKPEPVDTDHLAFPEGREKRRLHLIRERNRAVVAQAKKQWRERDPLLRCMVCNFSFVEAYGAIGDGFLEAHHRLPIATLKPGDKTRVEDLEPVCANCHRMVHRQGEALGEGRILRLDELKERYEKAGQIPVPGPPNAVS